VARLRQGRQSRWKDGFSVRLQKNTGKMGKSSVPVLSAAKPWFSQSFAHFWPIACAIYSQLSTVYSLITPWGVAQRVARVVSEPSFFHGKHVVLQQRGVRFEQGRP
jgi:hypothetical protein